MNKKKIIIVAMFMSLVAFCSKAQLSTPGSPTGTLNINYVRTWDALKPESSKDSFTVSTSVQKAKMATAYVDGLGRTIQTVVKQGSMVTGDTARDLIVPTLYDEFSREVYKYMPFAANTTGGNTYTRDGFFKMNAFWQDSAFNKAHFSDETYYYSKSDIEASPLNRVNKT